MKQPREVVITGVGVVLQGMIGNVSFINGIHCSVTPAVSDSCHLSIDDTDLASLVNARRVRRLSAYVKYSLAATTEACRDAGLDPPLGESCCALLGSVHGSAGYSTDYYREIVGQGIGAANPMLFAEGVPNAAAAHLSMAFGLKGGCQTLIGSRTGGLDALRLAALRIAAGQCDRAIVSAGEESSATVAQAYQACTPAAANTGDAAESATAAQVAGPFGCGAVTLVLESADAARQRGARVRAHLTAAASAAALDGSAHQLVAQGRRLCRSLGPAGAVLLSATDPAMRRIEAAWPDQPDQPGQPEPVVSHLPDHLPDVFSVTPLAALAAILLTGNIPMPPRVANASTHDATSATSDPMRSSFIVLSLDAFGQMAGVRVDRVER